MGNYRKKPVVIEAFKWTGDVNQTEDPEWIIDAMRKDFFEEIGTARIIQGADNSIALEIFTLEGRMVAQVGDWVIRGIKGEIYPCKPDIFETTYEPVD